MARDAERSTDRVLTIPNALSVLRLLGVPLFLWLVLGPQADGWALGVLAASAATDYLDGKIARATGQVSNLGKLLDPAADRLYILSVVVGLAIRGIIPVWLAVILPLRDVLLAGTVPGLRRRGMSALPVHFLGKAATFCLLYAFPLLFLGNGESTLQLVARVIGWAFAIWGVALYWWAGVLYVVQWRHVLRTFPPAAASGQPASES